MPLDSELTSGDTIEIFTSKVEGAGPSRDWLKFVKTHRAANKIRQWYSRERREDAIETGTEELIKALRREGLPVQKIQQSKTLDEVAEALNYADLDALQAAIGENHVSAKSVAERVRKHLAGRRPHPRGAAARSRCASRPRPPPPRVEHGRASTSRASTT